MFCFIVRWLESCGLVFALFGVSWVIPKTVFKSLACWQGRFHNHRGARTWKAVHLGILWIIWRERNGRTFDGVEHLIHIIKQSML